MNPGAAPTATPSLAPVQAHEEAEGSGGTESEEQRDTNLTHRAAEKLADAERAQRSLGSNRSSRRRGKKRSAPLSASSPGEPPDTTSPLWLQWKTDQLKQRDINLTHRAAERLADAERAQRSLASNRSSRRRRRVCMQGPDSESERDNDLESDSDPAFVP